MTGCHSSEWVIKVLNSHLSVTALLKCRTVGTIHRDQPVLLDAIWELWTRGGAAARAPTACKAFAPLAICLFLCYYCVHITRTPWFPCEGQRTPFGSQVLSFHLLGVLGIKFGSLGFHSRHLYPSSHHWSPSEQLWRHESLLF